MVAAGGEAGRGFGCDFVRRNSVVLFCRNWSACSLNDWPVGVPRLIFLGLCSATGAAGGSGDHAAKGEVVTTLAFGPASG